jgi:hypothetical protein
VWHGVGNLSGLSGSPGDRRCALFVASALSLDSLCLLNPTLNFL